MSLLKDSAVQQINPQFNRSKYSVAQFRSNKIVVVNEYLYPRAKREMHERSIKNLEAKGTVTTIKKATISKIDKMLSNWMKALIYEAEMCKEVGIRPPHMPVFVTLTLPALQIHSDIVIKREVLMPFIQYLKRHHNVKYYFWKAELQQNYNLHFHLIIDSFVSKKILQEKWNHYCNSLQYTDRFRNKYGHDNPPSTHVQQIKSLKSMTSYVTKYVTKNSNGAWIDGRLWDASRELKLLKAVSFVIDNHLADEISWLIEHKKITVYEEDFFCVLSFTKKFDHNRDYKYFRSIERCEYLKMYQDLYVDKIYPDEFEYQARIEVEPNPVQLSLFDVADWNVNYVMYD